MTDVEWIRLYIGDSGDAEVFTDAEIQQVLTDANGNKWLASAWLLQIWAQNLGKNPKFTIGRFSEDFTAAAEFLMERAREILNGPHVSATGVYVGGISEVDKQTKEADSDRVSPAFKRGMFDNPNSGW